VPVLLLVGAGHAHLYVVKRAPGSWLPLGTGFSSLAPRYFDGTVALCDREVA
jgi:hypothetical protein